ncbi:hypothetical protein HPB52_002690 [Rhipicephalus sanguineus]|uniref:Pogo transposable element n=1 Tax=Rhipicephalus sanguineus TaxID=34632 RepID=A0A9D4QGK4_RHISA|nr:hypothetical protein HPB52_002690 [Rhipicephalus sanguineus]
MKAPNVASVIGYGSAPKPIAEASYTVAKKIEVIRWHREDGKNVHQTSRHFKLDRKRIREWEKNFDNLLQLNYGKAKLRRKLCNCAPVFSEHVDNALFEYLERERSAGRAVSNRILSEEAVKIANSMQLGNFRNDDTLYNMANMDQTMVRIDNPANRTNNVVGESTIRIVNTGCARRGFTVCLAACATGHKLPAFIIFNEQSGKIPARASASVRIPGRVTPVNIT